MKSKQLFIGLIIILLATTLLFPKTEEQRYCHQYSGQSNTNQASAEYNACQTNLRCKIDKDSVTKKETDSDLIVYMCIPNNESSSTNNFQNKSEFPE